MPVNTQPPAPNSELKYFNSGVQNLLDDTLIAGDAASDASNWYDQDGRLKLIPGRTPVGAEGLLGKNTGQKFGYKTDGTLVHYAKHGTAIQYFDGTNWQNCITGLTENADYFMANYSSLAGAFTFFIGPDGIFFINNAVPSSSQALYLSTKNFKFAGGIIDKGRMIAWGRKEDKTGLYGSYIDAQNSTVYSLVSNESIGTGDGSTKTFTHTLAFKATHAFANSFGLTIAGSIGTLKSISGITKANPGVVTATAHGFTTGDTVIIKSVVGMTQVNDKVFTVTVIDADNFSIGVDSSGYTSYSSAGTASKCEVFTDTYLGTLTSPQGGTGTIDYLTGAVSVTFNTAPVNTGDILGAYEWQDMTVHGIADFSHSGSRIAGEGFQFPQDEGGDPILAVVVGLDGNYYSAKKTCFYALSIGADDVTADNNVYRRDLGIQSPHAICPTQFGIVFMNTANPSKPVLTILQRNPVGGEVEPTILFPNFAFVNYDWSDAAFDTYERYIVMACRSMGAVNNDTILLGNPAKGTMSVDITSYPARTFARDNSGNLFIGSPITKSVYNVFSGNDDNGDLIQNFWRGKGELFQPPVRKGHFYPTMLKKHRKLRFKGMIAPNQSYQVWVDYDDTGPQLVGTVLGNGSYVDYGAGVLVGQSLVGNGLLGGITAASVFPYYVELRIKKPPKFLKRAIIFKALGFGYVDINYQNDWGLMFFEDKLPVRFRQKQNVSLDGTQTNLPSPEF